MSDENEKRKICEGCRTGNYYLCNSFPGRAPEHAEREIEYRRRKARRLEAQGGRRPEVFQRDDELV